MIRPIRKCIDKVTQEYLEAQWDENKWTKEVRLQTQKEKKSELEYTQSLIQLNDTRRKYIQELLKSGKKDDSINKCCVEIVADI